MTSFIHLHIHSEYSLADGLFKVKGLAATASEKDMPAIALTDKNNLFGLVKFYEACVSQGVKPIIGAELQVFDDNLENPPVGRIVAIAMNAVGYRNLIRLVSLSFTDSVRRGMLSESELFSNSEGLLVLSGGVDGHVWSALHGGNDEDARAIMLRWREHFGDRYYVELTRTGRSDEERVLRQAVQLAADLELGVVATNDVCFELQDDFEAHETRVCIHEGRMLDDSRRERRHSQDQYLKSTAEMTALFADIPQACVNTVEIAKRCNVQINLGTYFLPDYPIPAGQTPEGFLKDTAHAGLQTRLERHGIRIEGGLDDYVARLDFELDVINQMGFAGYFLIVMEFIGWARDNDIPVGPGRGSGAGSLVAYSLGITDLDPLEYELLFERFLNPERVSMPDFDVDFCMEGRDRVIQHVSELYGVDAVSQIITFGTMAAKAVVRDVARVQGKPYGLADKLSKLIPFEVGMTLTKAMDESAELNEFVQGSEEVAEIMEMAYKLEGIVRNVGRHAGGVVIAPSRLTDFVPLYTEDVGGSLVSQFDKDDVERAGLVKFDFLGLKTLTIIDWAVQAINADREPDTEPLDIDQIDLNDREAFSLLRAADTTGIFQLESRGMKDLIIRLVPDGIDDIIALVALFRPGPLQSGAVDDYINRKHKREPVVFPHPSLESVLEATYGVVLYQEQVMQIAQELAGFSLGQADLLRRAMGKKKLEEMARVREQFLAGTDERDVDHKLASDIFDLMEKFAGYAFNKSHSATYAVVSFQTAWLKAHHPAQFMAANLSADMQNIDRVVVLIDEVRRMQTPLMPPSVNLSTFRFSVQNHAIVYGLGAVRGVGEGPVEAIVNARSAGSFGDLSDFCCRVDTKKVNKRVLEALIASGAMDEFALPAEDTNHTRARLRQELPQALQGAEQVARNSDIGISDMFGEANEVLAAVTELEPVTPLATRDRLQGEKETLGLYLTGHPIEEYRSELQNFCPQRIVDLRSQRGTQWIAGMVVSSRVMKSRRGAPMAFLVLDDRSARIEVAMFPDTYETYGRKVGKDELLIIEGEVQADEFTGGLNVRAEKVYDIGEARQRFSNGVMLDFSAEILPADFNERLKALLQPHIVTQAGCRVAIRYVAPSAQAEISLGKNWQVAATDDLLRNLKHEFGNECVQLRYANGR